MNIKIESVSKVTVTSIAPGKYFKSEDHRILQVLQGVLAEPLKKNAEDVIASEVKTGLVCIFREGWKGLVTPLEATISD
jgi:hypothetical protein